MSVGGGRPRIDAPPLVTERLRLHDIDLETLRGGAGAPLLVLHGPTTFDPAAPFLRRLTHHGAVIAPSHPGFGASARPDDFDTIYDLVRFYEHLLETLPPGDVTLIGCSFGGWLAAELAVTSARRLRRLVLIDPVGIKVGGREERDITHVFNTSPAELARRAWHDPGRQGPVDRGLSGLGLSGLGLGWQLHLDALSDEQLVTAARNWDALCLYAWRPHLYNPQLKRWLHRIQAPTLLLWGASDRIVTPEYGRAFGALVPGSRFEIVPEAGHHPELEQPDAVVEQIARFMDA